MIKRKLGKNGPAVTALGLGCMGISENYGPTDEKLGLAVIKQAYEMGVDFFDTADMYGKGANELLLGKAIKAFRDKIVVATKCGIERLNGSMRINNTPDYIKTACHNSLKRLEMDVIDLYYLHRFNPEVPIETSMETMLELINEGKILSVGLSEVDAEVIEKAHQILGNKLVAVQSEYSLVNRRSGEIVLPTCRKLGITFVPFSPIARGLLSGKIDDVKKLGESGVYDFRCDLPQFQPDAMKTNLRLVAAVSAIAKKKNCTPAQISLAWLLAQGDDIIPIPGTKRLDYLKENMGSMRVHLSQDDLAELSQAMEDHPIAGGRYPDALLKLAYLKF